MPEIRIVWILIMDGLVVRWILAQTGNVWPPWGNWIGQACLILFVIIVSVLAILADQNLGRKSE